jgi:hypothetical protein
MKMETARMFHKTDNETRNCEGCKFWSEMVAESIGGGPLEALCLNQDGKYSGEFTPGYVSCDKWESGEFGAVDDPERWSGTESEGSG